MSVWNEKGHIPLLRTYRKNAGKKNGEEDIQRECRNHGGPRLTFHGQISHVLSEGKVKGLRNRGLYMKRVMKVERYARITILAYRCCFTIIHNRFSLPTPTATGHEDIFNVFVGENSVVCRVLIIKIIKAWSAK